jgi:hypothetical protein
VSAIRIGGIAAPAAGIYAAVVLLIVELPRFSSSLYDFISLR